jgi:hypothetical protein
LSGALIRGDESSIHQSGLWEAQTFLSFYNHTPNTDVAQQRIIARRFREFGLSRFRRARPPVIPGLPTLADFIATKPFAKKVVKKKSSARADSR